MASMSLYNVWVVLLGIPIYTVQCCGLVEIGQRYIINSTARVPPESSVSWQFGSTVIYDSAQAEPNMFPSLFLGSRTSLLIPYVKKEAGKEVYKQNIGITIAYTCELSVYKRPSAPTCENVALTENHIRTECTTAQVFPQGNCQFILQNGGVAKEEISHESPYISYTHTDPQTGEHEYYSTSCTLQYPTNELKPGNWTVQVNIYPDVPGVSSDQGATGQAANHLTLAISTVRIEYNDCPKGLAGEDDTNVRQGYIREGERASCLCTRVDAGIPPGALGWTSSKGGNFKILSQTGDASTIQINSPDTFTCQSTPLLNGSEPKTYTPKYAYGPSSASVIFQPPGPVSVCHNQRANVDITCEVPDGSFKPALLFNIRDENNNNLATKAVNDKVNYNFTKPGQYTFTCRAENTIFSDLFIESPTSAIQVYEPPRDPPKISARSSQHGRFLVEGDDVIVTCSVSGGYPSVQSVTVTCGQDPSLTSKGNSVKLPIQFIQLKYDEANCTCQASHVTGCYDLVDVLTLTVLSVNTTITEIKVVTQLFTPAELAGGIIGTMVTFVVLVAAIALIVFYVRRVKRQRNKDTGYDMVELPPDQGVGQQDQSVGGHDPNYLTINPPDPSPSNEYTNEATENSHTSQAFGDNTEPTERADVNAYSEIKDADVNAYIEIKDADVNDYS